MSPLQDGQYCVTRQATRAQVGPWYVMQARNPSAPGMKCSTLLALIRKGQVTPRSVIRGPTTFQLWRFAARVKGISREFGLCYSCGGEVRGHPRSVPDARARRSFRPIPMPCWRTKFSPPKLFFGMCNRSVPRLRHWASGLHPPLPPTSRRVRRRLNRIRFAPPDRRRKFPPRPRPWRNWPKCRRLTRRRRSSNPGRGSGRRKAFSVPGNSRPLSVSNTTQPWMYPARAAVEAAAGSANASSVSPP